MTPDPIHQPDATTTQIPRGLRAPRVLAVAIALALSCSMAASVAARESTPPGKLRKVASFAHQVTGVTVSEDGRIFVNFPRWTEDTAVSVAELKNGKLVPYPDAAWNTWRNATKDASTPTDHWICVQSVVADRHGSLWVLDPAAPAMGAVVSHGPKLVQVDLKTDRVVRTIAFDEVAAPQGSYLNDVRFSPDGKTAYLTDSGAKGALLVVDLATAQARRRLDGDPSTQPDPKVTVDYGGRPLRRPDGRGVEFSADGIALSRDGSTLYWQAIKGSTLYRVATEALASDRPDLSSEVHAVGANGPADGLMIARGSGVMYVTSPQDDAIRTRDLSRDDAPLELLLRDPRLRWPDTFGEGPDGTVYVTSSHIQDSAFFKPGAPVALPTELWAIVR